MIDLIAKNNNGSLWIVPKRRKNMSAFDKLRAQRAADRLNEVIQEKEKQKQLSLFEKSKE